MNNHVPPRDSSGEAFRSFKPHPIMKTFLMRLSLFILLISTLPWSIPITIAVRVPAVTWIIGVGVHGLVLIAAVFINIWAQRYYETIEYSILPEWLQTEGGVIWRHRAQLPIGRVQMVTATQGPLQRKYGVGNVGIYTAATGQITAEMSFVNVSNPDALRDHVLNLIAKTRSGQNGLEEARWPERLKNDAEETSESAVQSPTIPTAQATQSSPTSQDSSSPATSRDSSIYVASAASAAVQSITAKLEEILDELKALRKEISKKS